MTTRSCSWPRAPSQDPEHRLLRAALEGLADEPVRVLATLEPAPPEGADLPEPPNARLVEWVSYARTMPRCDAGGLPRRATAPWCARSRAACPWWPARTRATRPRTRARLRWSGLGVSLPRRLHNARGVRLAVRRLLAEPAYARRSRALPPGAGSIPARWPRPTRWRRSRRRPGGEAPRGGFEPPRTD